MSSKNLRESVHLKLNPQIKNIVFDLGGVLIDWNPRYLYRNVFSDESEMEYFLAQICNHAWNEQHDAGRPFREGIAELSQRFPKYREQIELYFSRWNEMIRGAIAENVELFWYLKDLKKPSDGSAAYRLLALTNWSAETFPYAFQRFDFLRAFEFILVSGEHRLKKPDAEIFYKLCEMAQIRPEESLFIDDSRANLLTAEKLGFTIVHCQPV